VAPDDCVGIFVELSIDLLVGVWGILFSGSAYLPLSPEYPEERLRYMIEDTRAKVIFSQEHLSVKMEEGIFDQSPRIAELAPQGTTIVTLFPRGGVWALAGALGKPGTGAAPAWRPEDGMILGVSAYPPESVYSRN
jgi:non-ribosomal peptide synthetase component F